MHLWPSYLSGKVPSQHRFQILVEGAALVLVPRRWRVLDAAGALGPLVLVHFKLFEGLAVLVRHDVELLEEPRRVAAPAQVERRRAARMYIPKRRQVVAPPVDDPEVVEVVVVLLRRVRAQVLALGPAPGCYGTAGGRGLLTAAAHDTACCLRASAAQRPIGAARGDSTSAK